MKKTLLILLLLLSFLMGANTTADKGEVASTPPLVKSVSPVDSAQHILDDAKSIKLYGAKGDGIADDTLAIQKAINSESKLFFPRGRYKTSYPIYPRSNSIMISDHATIFYTKEYGVAQLLPAFYFIKNIHHVKMLGHWIFEGDSPHSSFNRETASPDDTYVEGIKIKTNCSDIYIESLEGFNFTAGVMEIGADHPYNKSSTRITVDKIKAYNCWNATLAITSGSDIHYKNVETFGAKSNPNYAQIGFDIETNTVGDKLENIQIDKIVTHDNEIGFQVLTKTEKQRGISINEIKSYANSDNGINLLDATEVRIKRAEIFDNGGAGVFLEGSFRNIAIEGGELHHNKKHGVLAQMDGSEEIERASEKLNLGINIYDNHDYGVVLSGTKRFPVRRFVSRGKIYDDRERKTQLTGIDVSKNVFDINITGSVYGNKYYQIRK